MEQWYKFQPEEYLEATRQSFLADDYAPVIAKRCGIQDYGCILEVGCGTGAFSRYIAQCVENAKFIGLDKEPELINYYNRFQWDTINTFSGIIGDAYELPFEEGVFDAVCSHTFLTCVPHPHKVMKEMMRVCKAGGIVSSITAMSWQPEIFDAGSYPGDSREWIHRFWELYRHMYAGYYEQFQGMSMAQGVQPNKVPAFFKECGLEAVSVLAVGRAFSLSDAGMSREQKERYISNFYLGEQKKARYLSEYNQKQEVISEKTIQEFLDYLSRWKIFWLDHVDDNSIWEWWGGTQLLTTGKKAR